MSAVNVIHACQMHNYIYSAHETLASRRLRRRLASMLVISNFKYCMSYSVQFPSHLSPFCDCACMLNLLQWSFMQEVQVVFKGHNLELCFVLLQSNIKCPFELILKVMENSSPNAAVMPNHRYWGQRNFQLHPSNV